MAASAADKKKYLDDMRGLLASYGAAGGAKAPASGEGAGGAADGSPGEAPAAAGTEGNGSDFLGRQKELTSAFRKARKEILSHNLRGLKSKDTDEAIAEHEKLVAEWDAAGDDLDARQAVLDKLIALAKRVRALAEEEAGQDSEMKAIMEQDARIYEQVNRLRGQLADEKAGKELWARFQDGHNKIWNAQHKDDLKGAREGLEVLRGMLGDLEDAVRKAGGNPNPPEDAEGFLDATEVEFHKRKTKLFAEAQQMVRKLPSGNEAGFPDKVQEIIQEFDGAGDRAKEKERLIRKLELIIREMGEIIEAAEEKQQAMEDVLEEGRDLRGKINERLETLPDRDRLRLKKEVSAAWAQFVEKGEKQRELFPAKDVLVVLRRIWREIETLYPADAAG